MKITVFIFLPVFMANKTFAGWEEALTFFPSKFPHGYYHLTQSDWMTIEDHFFITEDGLKLHGWIAKPKKLKSQFWLLWLPGNGGNLSHRFSWLEKMVQLPINIFLIDYRGYGKSEGKPTEAGIYKDATAAYEYLTKRRKTPPDKIILFGESLGGATAIDLASRVQSRALIVQSTFTNAKDMAKRIMPILPLWLMIKTKLDNLSKIEKVTVPKLFIHSPADEVVPYKLGRKLYDSAPPPKQFYEIPNAGHNETYLVGGESYLEALRKFIYAEGTIAK